MTSKVADSPNSRWIDIPTKDGSYGAYLSLPPAGTGPGILLLQEVFGVNRHMRHVADQYAAAGFVVVAPDIFHRQVKRVELGYEGADREQAINLMKQTDVPSLIADLVPAVATLRALPECNGKVATIGYCFGGRLVYLLAAEGVVDAGVSYYGGGIHDLVEKVKPSVPMMLHYGELDKGIPLPSVQKVEQAFADRKDVSVFVYNGADHGFNCWDRSAYHKHSSVVALGRTLGFLSSTVF